jgi:hypothetical protein
MEIIGWFQSAVFETYEIFVMLILYEIENISELVTAT